MGFRPEPTIYKLSFVDTFLDGLHVSAGCCTVKEYNQFMQSSVNSAVNGIADEIPDDPDEAAKVIEELRIKGMEALANNEFTLGMFIKYLVSWDLEDADGNPVPTTREGLDSQERIVIGTIIGAWQQAIVSIPNRSKPSSHNGKISEEQSLGLASVSGSLGS